MRAPRPTPRLLIVPGLHDSGPAHWQTWLEARVPGSVRVRQHDWARPDLDTWAQAVGDTLRHAGSDGPWIAAAHSFGCLALVRHLQQAPRSPVQAALLVAPADPEKFGVAHRLPQARLAIPTTLVGSRNDPWMRHEHAQAWAERWGSHWLSLGEAGHINVEAGFHSLPLAARWVQARQQKLHGERRGERADIHEWSFAV